MPLRRKLPPPSPLHSLSACTDRQDVLTWIGNRDKYPTANFLEDVSRAFDYLTALETRRSTGTKDHSARLLYE